VIDPVPHARRGHRLLGVDPLREIAVEAEEIDELTGGIDLGLKNRLALTEHGGRVHPLAPRSGQQVGRLEEHRRAVLEAPARPVPMRPPGRGHRRAESARVGLMRIGQVMRMPMRRNHPDCLPGSDILAVHDDRDVGDGATQPLELRLDRRALRSSRCVGQHRLVARGGDVRGPVHALSSGVVCRAVS
jgi:hypothetical protein